MPISDIIHMIYFLSFTSESKEAIAQYPEIIKEMKLAIQECGRKLGMYVNKKKRIKAESKKRGYIETFIPHVSAALIDLGELKESEKIVIEDCLREILEKMNKVRGQGPATPVKVES